MQDKLLLEKVFVHNLQGIDLELPHNALIAFCGVSGSGKSSLAFDTLFQEGQRRYIESLSSLRRAGKEVPRVNVKKVEGMTATIAIEQKTSTGTVRSTVGTLTEVYDFLRVLFARCATPYCPISGEKVEPQSKTSVAKDVLKEFDEQKLVLLAPIVAAKKSNLSEEIDSLLKKGFLRARIDGHFVELEEQIKLDPKKAHSLEVVVDRVVVKKEQHDRILEAIFLALEIAEGVLIAYCPDQKREKLYSTLAYSPKSGMSYTPLEPIHFSFNNPQGMCPQCQGLGVVQTFALEKIIDFDQSISEDCCLLQSSYTTVRYKNIFDNLAKLYKFSVKTPFKKLTSFQQDVLLNGSRKKWIKMHFVHPVKKTSWQEYVNWQGILFEAKERYNNAKSDVYKNKIEGYMTTNTCPKCLGARIKPYAASAKLREKTLFELTQMSIEECYTFFSKLELEENKKLIAEELIKEIQFRLFFLLGVGLHYLSLNRTAPTLSGGEAQRVKLASSIGCGLVGMTYILDEPSIGLHAQDNHKLIQTLQGLKEKGNTVIVVEHDEETLLASDYIVEIGPGAGNMGGNIVFSGPVHTFLKQQSLTSDFLNGKNEVFLKRDPKKSNAFFTLKGARGNNLKSVTLDIPLGKFVVVSGVSGSGKSTLIMETLYPALFNVLNRTKKECCPFDFLKGEKGLDKVIQIDQSPIGRMPRSNPATYTKVFDLIRDLFANLPESKARGYQKGRFSFNVKSGSCARCLGAGQIKIEMDFMEDAFIQCPLCFGKRFDQETLSVLYRGKNIYDVLEMTVSDALKHFEAIPHIKIKLETLKKVGLDYITLGQSSTTLSGGEAQRIKLSKELSRPSTSNTLYILDEPTTGLHFKDIQMLLNIFKELTLKGNTVVVIEHNMDVIKNADHIIDLGPTGGKGGGKIVAMGSVEQLCKTQTATGIYLKKHLKRDYSVTKEAIFSQKSEYVDVKGASMHNLKEIDAKFPHNQISIVCGPSGCGKSSLAFDTVYSEGQRRFVETMPAYFRQFIKQMPKPKVERIDGLRASVAIEQKNYAGNVRSTVGTMTEIYDYLRILFATIGRPHDPDTMEEIQAISKEIVVQNLLATCEDKKLIILAPLPSSTPLSNSVKQLKRQGFLRMRFNGTYYELDETIEMDEKKQNTVEVVIDRLKANYANERRLLEAVDVANLLADGKVLIDVEGQDHFFNLRFSTPSTGKSFPQVSPSTFLFNQEGMCPECEGVGVQYGAHLETNEAILSDTLAQLLNSLCQEYTKDVFAYLKPLLDDFDIDPDVPLETLPKEQLDPLFKGVQKTYKKTSFEIRFIGLNPLFEKLGHCAKRSIKDRLGPFLETNVCASCNGTRLNRFARAVTIHDQSIATIVTMPIEEVYTFISKIELTNEQKVILKDVLEQIKNRLECMLELGIGYLDLNRSSTTLSGGEFQRVRLSSQIGTKLTGLLYVLDEPTIGLHPSETQKLISALQKLKQLGNTLIMVEHDPMIIEMADQVFDMGPHSGQFGGKILSYGTLDVLKKDPNSITGQYLSGKQQVQVEMSRPEQDGSIEITNASIYNLKGLNCTLPNNHLICLTGVSGSGKSTLLHDVLKKAFLKRRLSKEGTIDLKYAQVKGLDAFDDMVAIDQNPIGSTTRSDIATYIDVLTPLRHWFGALPEAVAKGLIPRYFSYYHRKGMCPHCFGFGYKTINLQFLPSVKMPCEQCHGKRLNPISLSIKYKGKSIADYLDQTIEENLNSFGHIAKVKRLLTVMLELGLGYLKLNQEMHTLSGGEAGRLRLLRDVAKKKKGKTLYLFDEPTIGLHFSDIEKLLKVFDSLKAKGHTLVIIEHNLDVIKHADYIVDLGPFAGPKGGQVLVEGPIEKVQKCATSQTAKFL